MPNHENEFPRPRVFIQVRALQKLRAYVKACPVELNGFGIVKRSDNDFLIADVFILPQQAGAAWVDTDDEALHSFMFELASRGQSTADIKLQWHSHASMSAYCSGTDRETISNYKCDFMISLVINKRDETFCRLDLFQPFRLGLAVPLEILVTPDLVLEKECAKEVEEKVKIEKGGSTFEEGFRKLVRSLEQDGEVDELS